MRALDRAERAIRRSLYELGLVAPAPAPEVRAVLGDRTAVLDRVGKHSWDEVPKGCVRIDVSAEVLTGLLRRERRVAFLDDLRRKLAPTGEVVLALRTVEGVPVWGRLLLDGPRLALGGTLSWLPEPGTRFFGNEARHVYFTTTSLEAEIRDAGLEIRSWSDGVLRLGESGSFLGPPSEAEGIPVVAVVAALVRAERLRRLAPREALRMARRIGETVKERGDAERRALRDRIQELDGAVPPGPNCFRRVLAESLLDRGAARERVTLSLDVGKTGHAHFRSDPQGPQKAYDVDFEV